ncbi:MAG: hypothetical protein IJZ39_01300 [Oscillospiraceae bacterium]|nr:hypothetical protein [Oscillospiraceae bacterium]
MKIREVAMAGKLDVLPVYMFERIGRRDDETSFGDAIHPLFQLSYTPISFPPPQNAQLRSGFGNVRVGGLKSA